MIGFYPYDLCWNRHFLPLALVELDRQSRKSQTAQAAQRRAASAPRNVSSDAVQQPWREATSILWRVVEPRK